MPSEASETASLLARVKGCITGALPSALKTGTWLLAITVPLSFAVLLLKLTGLLAWVAKAFAPLFVLVGLPGEAAIVFATSCLLNIYSAIVVITTLDLTGRTVTILALMCLIAHNLVVESAVLTRAGSKGVRLAFLRLAVAFAAAFALSLLLPADAVPAAPAALAGAPAVSSLGMELRTWASETARLCVKIMVLVTLLMILERLLAEFGVTRFLSRLMRFPLRLLGLPDETAFLWIVANTLGLAYGAGVIVEHVRRGLISREHADALNHHVAISHSLLEDTCLFAAIGVPVGWITLPRLVLAGVVVWGKRLIEGASARGRTR